MLRFIAWPNYACRFYHNFIDKYIDRSDFESLEMDTDSNYFSFLEDSIQKAYQTRNERRI